MHRPLPWRAALHACVSSTIRSRSASRTARHPPTTRAAPYPARRPAYFSHALPTLPHHTPAPGSSPWYPWPAAQTNTLSLAPPPQTPCAQHARQPTGRLQSQSLHRHPSRDTLCSSHPSPSARKSELRATPPVPPHNPAPPKSRARSARHRPCCSNVPRWLRADTSTPPFWSCGLCWVSRASTRLPCMQTTVLSGLGRRTA